ncbi:MAG: S-layer homology domain-containing protein [Clostridia bacterium]|nr:S-layer homology domain-containing protein [Clostridia bacterium]
MKNLKKLMSVILTVAMLMSLFVSASAATFTDVDDTNAAYEAIEVLSALEILTGREDGSFDPDANIKRSEFAAVICRTMNAEAAASGSSANFNDVAANHWAAGYIGWAAGSGIVNGKGDGNFDPDANVTYQEAVTMIVRAMGFEPLATKKGGFPTGYMAVANTYGITNGVAMSPANGAATRAGVAKLVYNSFDAPLMDASFITLGDEEEYSIFEGKTYMGGSYDERRTLLSQYSDIYKVKATVANTYRSDATLIKSNGDMQIELAVVANGLYKFPAGQIMNEFGLLLAQVDGTGTTFKPLFNDTTVGELLGYTVNAYLTVNADGELEVIALVPDMKSIETMTFTKPVTEISSVTVASATAAPVFSYWENDRLKDAKMDVAGNVGVYVNGVYNNTIDAFTVADINNGTYSSVTLLGSKATGLYNKVMLTQYEYAMVESVDTELAIITTDKGDLTLNEDEVKDEFIYSIIKDGAEIELADIAEGDILNIISDNAADFTVANFADIYVSNETIEATVSQYNPSTFEYTIDGAEYEKANGAALGSLNAGDAGIFYLTIDGYLYDAELTKGFSGNYAFVIDMALDTSSFGQTWQIKMLNKDNAIVTYDVKNNVKVDGIVKKNDACTGLAGCVCDQCAALATLKAAVDTPDPATAATRLISYNLSGDEISVIDFADTFTGSNERDFNKATLAGGAKYNNRTERLDSYNLLSGTVVFNAPFDAVPSASPAAYTLDENKVQVYTVSGLEDDQTYAGYVFDVDSDMAIGATLITSNMGFAGKANALAVVKSVSTGLDAAGNSADIVNFFQAGEMKSLAVTNDAYVGGSFDASDLSAGDIIQYTTNAAGEINNMVGIFDMEEYVAAAPTAVPPVTGSIAFDGGVIEDANDVPGKIEYHVGVVEGISSKFVTLNNNYATKTLGWDLDANATNVLFDVAKASANVNNAFAAKSGIGYIREAKDTAGTYTTDVYVAVVKVDDGAVVEVVTYKYDKATAGTTSAFEAKFDKR